MNFFTWIRDGVRQAVLMGVSDAVGDLGTRTDGDDINQRLLEVLRTTGPADAATPRIADRSTRKKLGRSLQQIQAGAAKAS